MSDVLSKDYVPELIKSSLTNSKVLDICSRFLKYEYLQTEAQKKIVKYIFDTYNLTGSAPTIGTIAQAYPGNTEVIALLSKIKKLNIDGKHDALIDSFERFVKDIRFQSILKKVADLYNESKQAEAVKVLAQESKEIEQFTLKDKYYVKVFKDFNERMKHRQLNSSSEEKALLKQRLTSGIHDFDMLIGGGFKRGTSFLGIARSGIGKSTFLRWVAICNARLGKRVVFFQAEDTEENAMETFDMAWTALTSDEIEDGMIPSHIQHQVDKVRREILARGGEIILVAQENFDKMTIEECDTKLDDIERIEGPVDMVLFDYLEIFTSKGVYGKGDSAERRRREDIAEKIVAMATKRKIVTGTCTQSNDIEPEKVNNPDFKITRHNASECKGVIKPFAYFFSFNCTAEEYDQEILRIYMDKLRKYKADKTLKIYQARSIGRFYDAIKTQQTFGDYNRSLYAA